MVFYEAAPGCLAISGQSVQEQRRNAMGDKRSKKDKNKADKQKQEKLEKKKEQEKAKLPTKKLA
jgi:hypothetical protein